MESTSLAEHFHRYFELKLATSEDLLGEAQRLRYRVYCEEFGYEDKTQFPDGREYDDYDNLAFHVLITHKPSGKTVSCLRLIPASLANPLPFETICPAKEAMDSLPPMPRSTMCEISRVCVDSEFRRRTGEQISMFGNYQNVDLSPNERRLLPFIGISILLAGTALTFLSNRRNILAMMEAFLTQSVKKIGIHFQQIGSPVEYHGVRALYHTRSESVYTLMKPELKDLFHSLYAQLHPYFSSAPMRPFVELSGTHAI